MTENDMKTGVVEDEKLENVTGGITLKPDSGFFSWTYCCTCGCKDFRIDGVSGDKSWVIASCKNCGLQYSVPN